MSLNWICLGLLFYDTCWMYLLFWRLSSNYLSDTLFVGLSSIPQYWDWVFNDTLPTKPTITGNNSKYYLLLPLNLSLMPSSVVEYISNDIFNLILSLECVSYHLEYHPIHYQFDVFFLLGYHILQIVFIFYITPTLKDQNCYIYCYSPPLQNFPQRCKFFNQFCLILWCLQLISVRFLLVLME